METKTFEVRDAGTFIPCMGIAMEPTSDENITDIYLLRRAGYGCTRCILFGRMDGRDFTYDPYDRQQSPRTLFVAHRYIEEHWEGLESGCVIDVEWILGERDIPKDSETLHPF